MTARDPTADEMRVFLRGQFGDEPDAFDIEGAIYWFANDWHGGQASNLYSALSMSEFRPGPCCKGPERDSFEEICYQELEAEFAGVEHA